MLNLNLTAFQSQEFIVGIAVAAILVSALCASSHVPQHRAGARRRRRRAALSPGRRSGPDRDISRMVEKEIRALPEFSNGLVVGLAVAAVLMFGMQKRST